ncbi:TolC family protein [Siphonobacter sp. SORGH_AS_0500]|uniref:TolC family protein n=1 Tax=Siphonobacter sp. SORGH_AS_0500 TaxID=1864824 RepID=UPI00285F3AA1|nr:TolC family protein [Siphonobacter sp. SORGH_AS_0500]MDR6195683.1 outer membrane protein [Siphonobacter sp. SORGH_AS_0500]
MKTNTFLIAMLMAVLPSLSEAQNTQQGWTLKQCLEYGLKNFGGVRLAQYKVETANQQAREAISQYLPQVTGTGTFTDNIKLQRSVIPAGTFGNPEPLTVAFGQKYQNTVSAQATQTIYDKTLILGIKANEPNQKLAELNTRQTQEDVIYNITKNYYQVFVSQQQIALLKDNMTRTEQVLGVLKLQRDNGVIQPVDYTNTEVSYNNTRSQLVLAENSLELAINQLKYQMGLSQDQPLMLTDSSILKQLPKAQKQEFDPRNLVSFQQGERNLDLQRIQMARTKAGYLPTLTANASYGTLSFSNQFGGAFQNFLGFGTVGLRLNLPIFDGFKRDAQYQQNRLTVMTQEEQQRLNTEAYKLQYNNAESQLIRARTNTENDDRTVKLAQQVYEITTLQYKQGVKNLTDLLNADKSYREAQSNYINSLINYYQAQLNLEQSQGTLLNFYNQL